MNSEGMPSIYFTYNRLVCLYDDALDYGTQSCLIFLNKTIDLEYNLAPFDKSFTRVLKLFFCLRPDYQVYRLQKKV